MNPDRTVDPRLFPGNATVVETIDLEYRLRPRITRFLMERLERELQGDFSSFHFDVDLERREVRISEKTPAKYVQRIARDFMKEIGVNCC